MSKGIVLGADGRYYSIEGGKATVVGVTEKRTAVAATIGTVEMRDMDSSAVHITL